MSTVEMLKESGFEPTMKLVASSAKGNVATIAEVRLDSDRYSIRNRRSPLKIDVYDNCQSDYRILREKNNLEFNVHGTISYNSFTLALE